MGCLGGGSQKVQQTTKVELPKWQEDAYKFATNEAMRLYTGSKNIVGWQPVKTTAESQWGPYLSKYFDDSMTEGYTYEPIYGDQQEGGKLNYYSGGVTPLSQGQTQGIQAAYGLANSSPLSNSLMQAGNASLSNMMANPYSVSSIANIAAPTAYNPTEYTPTNYSAALATAPTLDGSGNTVTAPTLGNTPRISTKDIEAAIIKADYGKAWNEINPYVEQLAKNATDPVYRKFMEETIPALRSQAVAAGRYGGGIPELKEDIATRDAQTEMLAARGNIYGSAWENAAGREYSRASQQATLQQQAAQANQQARLAASTGNAELAQQKAIEAAKLQIQAQSLNQSTQTQYDLTGYQGNLQTALANQAAKNQASQIGYEGALRAGLAGDQNRLTAGLADKAAQLEASRLNQSTALQTEQQRIQAQQLRQQVAEAAAAQGLAQGTAGYNSQWTNAQNLYNFGNLERAYNQAVADEAANKANFEQMEPYQRLNLLLGAVGGNMGQTSTSTQSGGGASTLSQLAGLGLTGAGIYNLLGMGGAGAAAGTVAAAAPYVASAGTMAGMLGAGAGAFGAADLLGTAAAVAPFAASTKELKDEIKTVDDDTLSGILDHLDSQRIVSFRYIMEPTGNKPHLGVIAEESPPAILTDNGKAIDISSVLGVLLGAVKQLRQEVRQLKGE